MNVFDLEARIGLNTQDFDSGLEKSKSKLSSIGGAIKGGLATAAKVGAAAIGAASAATVAFGKSAVQAGMTFDSSMSQVAATMGKTVDEIGELRDFAQEMGSTTAFSASQAADALNYMALAGYDADKSMKMLPNVLNLAAAGSIDLAYASDMVTDAQSALGLSMEETTEMVDKMAMASSKSNTSIAQLGEAFLTVGGTAKTLSGGTTELSTALGILADNGVKGAEGGTALRNIILSLSAPTDQAAEKMQELGLQVFDANGNMRPLNETFNDLNSILSTMNQGEQIQTLNELFNKVDLKSVNALLANSGERFDELSGYIDNAANSAEKMANTQLDNLAGDITLFKSALEGAQIAVSDGLTPSLREFVQFGSSSLSRLTEAFKSDGVGGAIEEFGTLLSEALERLAPMLAEGIQFVSNAVMEIFSKLPEIIKNVLPTLFETARSILQSLGDGIRSNIDSITEIGMMIIDFLVTTLTEDLPELLQVAFELIITLVNGISQALPTLIPAIAQVILTINEALTAPENLMLLIEAAVQLIFALIKGIIQALPTLIETSHTVVENVADTIINALGLILQAGVQLVAKFIAGIVSKFGDISSTASDVFNTVKNGIVNKISEAASWGRDLIGNFIGGIKEKAGALVDAVSGIASTIASYLHFTEPDVGPLSNFHTYAPDMIDLFAKGMKESEGKLKAQLADTAGIIGDGFEVSVNGKSNTGSYSAGNTVINITVQSGVISNDYDSYRAAEKISQSLQNFKVMQARSLGGMA